MALIVVNVWRSYLWITDQLPVELCIKGLHVQTIDIQHRVADNTYLSERGETRDLMCCEISQGVPAPLCPSHWFPFESRADQ